MKQVYLILATLTFSRACSRSAKFKQVWLCSCLIAALMLLCLAPMPYGYYMLVRFVAMVVFGVMAYQYYLRQKTVATVVFVVLALLFQPINKKCARIRAAFVGQFDDYMAKSYYVDGPRGEAKKIALPRNLVIWE